MAEVLYGARQRRVLKMKTKKRRREEGVFIRRMKRHSINERVSEDGTVPVIVYVSCRVACDSWRGARDGV